MPKRIVHLKQSGELLTDQPGERWTATALHKAAVRIQEVQQQAAELGVTGLLVVSGGGNVPDGFGRGANIREKFGAGSAVSRYADIIGRRSTADNTIMLAAALHDCGVPCVLLAAPNSAFNDIELGPVPEYTPALVQAAYAKGSIVLMAGGSGKGGQTTDAAVMEYAAWQAAADPSTPSIALKATKYNGVFEADPALQPEARRYEKLSADYMLEHYDRFAAVDRRCLEILSSSARDAHVHLRVYAADHSIVEALRNDYLGTTIFPRGTPPMLATESPDIKAA